VEQAVWVAERLERLELALFEQPTRRGDHQAMAAVRRRSGIPIMADESVFTPQDALEVIRCRAADVLSLYPGKHGGIRMTHQIAKLAEAAGIPCTIGSNLEREVATAAMAHVTVCTANLQCERFPGDLIGPLYYQQALTREPLPYQGDRLAVPEGPGLGVEI
jgi:muconate cycloisomerase